MKAKDLCNKALSKPPYNENKDSSKKKELTVCPQGTWVSMNFKVSAIKTCVKK